MAYKKLKLNQTLSLFHLNTCSLNKNFDDLEYLIKTTNQASDIIAVSPELKVIWLLQQTLISLTNPLNTHNGESCWRNPLIYQ